MKPQLHLSVFYSIHQAPMKTIISCRATAFQSIPLVAICTGEREPLRVNPVIVDNKSGFSSRQPCQLQQVPSPFPPRNLRQRVARVCVFGFLAFAGNCPGYESTLTPYPLTIYTQSAVSPLFTVHSSRRLIATGRTLCAWWLTIRLSLLISIWAPVCTHGWLVVCVCAESALYLAAGGLSMHTRHRRRGWENEARGDTISAGWLRWKLSAVSWV